MAYCRFSTDDFQCDVYAFAHCEGGFAIYVAARRRVYHRPLPPPLPWPAAAATRAQRRRWVRKFMRRDRAVRRAGRHLKPIGGPFDGAHFREPTIAAAIARLEALHRAGYRYPATVLDELKEEQCVQ